MGPNPGGNTVGSQAVGVCAFQVVVIPVQISEEEDAADRGAWGWGLGRLGGGFGTAGREIFQEGRWPSAHRKSPAADHRPPTGSALSRVHTSTMSSSKRWTADWHTAGGADLQQHAQLDGHGTPPRPHWPDSTWVTSGEESETELRDQATLDMKDPLGFHTHSGAGIDSTMAKRY